MPHRRLHSSRLVLNRRDDEAGFTLIELVIVVAIMGILAAIGVGASTAIVRHAKAEAVHARALDFRKSLIAEKAIQGVDHHDYSQNDQITDTVLGRLELNEIRLAAGSDCIFAYWDNDESYEGFDIDKWEEADVKIPDGDYRDYVMIIGTFGYGNSDVGSRQCQVY